MSGTLPPLQQLSADNKGPIVVVVAYILVSLTTLSTIIRVVTFHTLKRGFGLDDAYLSMAAAIALIQTVLAQRAVDKGLGRRMDELDAADVDSYYRFTYAAQILSIIVMAFAKTSVVQLIQRLSQRRSRIHKACHILSGFVALWTVFSILSLALQCRIPNPWIYTPQRCLGSGALWYPIIVLNLLTDAVLAFLFAPVLWRLKMSRKHRLTITSLFCARLTVCVSEILEVAMLAPVIGASDQTGSAVNLAVVRQTVMNLSVITAAIPSLHRFLTDLQHGALGTRITEHQYELSLDSSNGLSGKFGLSEAKSHQDNDPKSAPSLQSSGPRLSSRIFSDHAPKSAGRGATERKQEPCHQIPEDRSTCTLSNNRVLQTWEISIEVENNRIQDTGMATTGGTPGILHHPSCNSLRGY